jgi:hypothetical protein
MTLDDAVQSFAQGIAVAEGFFVSGSRPQRDNNPGDLTVDTIGKGVSMDGPFVVYGSPEDGWDALKQQVRLMLTDASAFYNSNMTIREVAERYTTTDQMAWATNVAAVLGVSIDTKLSDLLSAAAPIGLGVLLVFAIIWLLRKK